MDLYKLILQNTKDIKVLKKLVLCCTSSGSLIESLAPTITSGVIAPNSTPAKVGDIYVDTSAKKLYFATGISSSSDWTIAN